MDSNLNWTEQIESLKTKLLKSKAILYITRYYSNEKSLYYIFIYFLKATEGVVCYAGVRLIKVKLMRLTDQ